jgi:hypothetical protein
MGLWMMPPTSSWSARNGSMPATRIAGATRSSYTRSNSTDPPLPFGLRPNGITTKHTGAGGTAERTTNRPAPASAAVADPLGATSTRDLQRDR